MSNSAGHAPHDALEEKMQAARAMVVLMQGNPFMPATAKEAVAALMGLLDEQTKRIKALENRIDTLVKEIWSNG